MIYRNPDQHTLSFLTVQKLHCSKKLTAIILSIGWEQSEFATWHSRVLGFAFWLLGHVLVDESTAQPQQSGAV